MSETEKAEGQNADNIVYGSTDIDEVQQGTSLRKNTIV